MQLSMAYIKEKWQHAGFQKYLRNTGWMLFGKVTSVLVSFLTLAYITRNLGPLHYGELSYAVSFVSLFSFVATLGFDQILYRDLIQHPTQRHVYIGSAIFIRFIASIIASIICVTIAIILSTDYISIFLIGIISMSFIFNSFQLLNYVFQANLNAKFPSIASLIITIILNILKILIVFFDQGILYLASILLLESILYACSFIWGYIRHYGSPTQWRINFNVIRQLLIESIPLTFVSAFALVYARIDQVIIKHMLDAASVGLYDIAVRITEVWYFIPTLFISSLLPALVNSKNFSRAIYIRRIKKLVTLLMLSAGGIILCTYLFGGYIIEHIFGAQFIGTIPVLNIYISSLISTFLNAIAINYLIIEKQTMSILTANCVGMILNIVLNIILIDIYGIIGAAVATVISYSSIFSIIILTSYIRKNIHV